MLSTLLLIGGILFSNVAYSDFLPTNNLYLEDSLESASNVTEEQFNQIIDQAIEIYAPIIAEHGKNLRFNRLWDNATVNANASQSGDTWTVNMYGGLARRPEVTPDGFALVVCHELGHHLGGFPAKSWAAYEGQSDYFATQSCGRLLWSNQTLSEMETLPDYPQGLCDVTYFGEGVSRLQLCYREMLAGYSLGNLLGTLGGTKVSYTSPDLSVVTRTNSKHPTGQCRLDTYMRGAICKVEFNTDLIPQTEKEAVKTSCHVSNNDEVGTRPTCWWKAKLKARITSQ